MAERVQVGDAVLYGGDCREGCLMLDDRTLWRVDCADCLPWLAALPAGKVRLVITSPPYTDARLYGINFRLRGQQWVEFMIPRVVEMCRVTEGLVCINMAGQVRQHSYQPVVEWLVADLTRHHGIVCGPAPYCYFRFGIPGFGGPRYHRRDWEPVYCFARPECLPLRWSDNTATGHPPKWAPGGEMSNRLGDGTRVNQWGRCGGHESGGTHCKNGKRQRKSRPSHVMTTKAAYKNAFGVMTDRPVGTRPTGNKPATEQYRAGGQRRTATRGHANGDTVSVPDAYDPPAVANAGSVIKEMYSAEQVRQLLLGGELSGAVVEGSPMGDLIRVVVGGNNMGSKSAHDSEAPFSEELVSYLVRSYAEEGSIVLDPFCGSGTALAVAVRLGRRALGCDLRESQCAIARERTKSEIGLFHGGP